MGADYMVDGIETISCINRFSDIGMDSLNVGGA
jgi:hypothetical protein